MKAVGESIELLYAAFAGQARPLKISYCPCCITDEEIATLLGSGLREIPPEVLAPYASSAFLTVGNVADYLYFLPRILEITATDDQWWPDPEVTGRAISTAKLDSWPASRLDALTGFLAAVIDSAIGSGEYLKIDPWMCAIARMGIDVRPYLQRIAASPDAVLAYFEDNARCLPKNRLCNAFWELPNAGHDAIVDWFHSEPIRKIPFEAYGYLMAPEGENL